MTLLEILIGRRLANCEAQQSKITTIEGLPQLTWTVLLFRLRPEAALTILLHWARPIELDRAHHPGDLLVLTLLAMSYWQTIEAYPVMRFLHCRRRESRHKFGLLAATGLMIDYVLNVAVGISAGIGALTSAIPELHPYTLGLCLMVLALITIANLRGTLEAGIIFALTTYLFVASLAGHLVWAVADPPGGGNPTPTVPPPALPAASEAVTLCFCCALLPAVARR